MRARWYVLLIEPRAEYLSAHELTRDGFQVFFPRIRVVNPRTGHEDAPLFPGYIFLRHEPDSGEWPSFRPVHRVVNWVKFGDDIPWISDEDVAELREQLDALNRGDGRSLNFRPGERVNVASKSLEGLARVVDGVLSPHGRIKVLLEFMGRMVPAQIPWENLERVEGQPFERPRNSRRTRGRGRWIHGQGAGAPANA